MKRLLRIKRILRKRKNLFMIFSGVVGIVMIWRGVWGLADIYLFPDHPEISFFFSIVGGLIILLADDYELEELSPHRGDQPIRALGSHADKVPAV